jgi:hypothetical protein
VLKTGLLNFINLEDIMSREIIDRVKEFLIKLFKDIDFQSRLNNSSIEERNRFLSESGYDFERDEFEAAVISVLEASEQGDFTELSQAELAEVFGGYVGSQPRVQPMYGVIWWPCRPICSARPPRVQPMYGVVDPKEFY